MITSSWPDPEFVRDWYPPKLLAAARLSWYADHFDYVEVNSTVVLRGSSGTNIREDPNEALDLRCYSGRHRLRRKRRKSTFRPKE
jgi:hypothetical protein